MKTLSLRSRLLLAFSFLALLGLLVAAIGYVSTRRVGAHVTELGGSVLPSQESLAAMQAELERIQVAQRTLMAPGLPVDVRRQQFEHFEAARRAYEQHWQRFRQHADGVEPRTLEELQQRVQAWHALNERFFAAVRALEAMDLTDPVDLESRQEGFKGDHHLATERAAQHIFKAMAYTGGTDPTACRFGRWLGTYRTANPVIQDVMQRAQEPHRQFHAAVAEIQAALRDGNVEQARMAFLEKMVPAAHTTIGLFTAILEETAKARKIYEDMNRMALVEMREKQEAAFALLSQIAADGREQAEQQVEAAGDDTRQAGRIVLVAALAGLGAALGLGWLIARSVTRKIHRVVQTLDAGAEQTAAAAGEIAAASSKLADDASQQAAALEESSATLAEIGSMTKQTTEQAQAAKGLSTQARSAAETSETEIRRMAQTMEAIGQATAEVARIAKSIDEIAFQTNILALNASVEAARAGEAGAGFAVVAEEVRALAQRAAEAARETATRIQAATEATGSGHAVVAAMQERLQEILVRNREVDAAMDSIVAAATEQRTGLDQINTAMAQMDKLTQGNAASAEETAAAAEELHAQTEELRAAMRDLHRIVDGAYASRPSSPGRTAPASGVSAQSETKPSPTLAEARG